MVSRTFAVYVDESPATTLPLRKKSLSKSASRSTTPLSPSNPIAALPLPDKENSHPVTGDRASSVGPSGKKTLKRKTGVLETKLYVPPTSKKSKDSSESVGSLKPKRRGVSAPPTSNTPTPESSSSPRKLKKTTSGDATSAAKARRSSARKANKKAPIMELPRVEEEPEVQEVEQDAVQVIIDAKCYELTVSPLADVSEAYEAAEPETTPLPAKKTKKSRVQTVDTEIRDYFDESHTTAPPRKLSRSVSLPVNAFCPTVSTSRVSSFSSSLLGFDFSDSLSTIAASSSSQSTLLSSPSWEAKEVEELLAQPTAFDTPERKRIYAAFTFSTPSPSSERYHRARSTSVDRFGDIEFVPLF